MIGCIHIRRVEAGDHGVESSLLFSRERSVCHGNVGVGEGVVVERGVRLKIVGWSKLAGILVRPLLLQRNTEKCYAPHFTSHDRKEVVNVSPLLYVIRQMEVNVVELIW